MMVNEIDIIRSGKLVGNVFRLPDVQLDRALYVKVKKILEGMDGKWNRQAQGFVFAHDPKPLFYKLLVSNVKVNIKKDFQLFETPEELAKEMVRLANLVPSDKVLEPSAGRGRILDALPFGVKAVAAELMPENVDILKSKGYTVIVKDFLKLPLKYKFNKIIANPPFNKNQDIEHIVKMYNHLLPGGRLVTLSSPGWAYNTFKKPTAFRAFLNKVHAEVRYIPENTFKKSGTTISTILIIIDKKDIPIVPLDRDFSEWIRRERSRNEQ